MIALIEPDATLHDALERMLLSNAGQAVVVDKQGRFQGIVDVEQLADVLKRLRNQAKKHYDELAANGAAEASQPEEPGLRRCHRPCASCGRTSA